ncbi:hypothetical protein ACFL6T_02235 [Candidatus Zixiibacteriota bacterium]
MRKSSVIHHTAGSMRPFRAPEYTGAGFECPIPGRAHTAADVPENLDYEAFYRTTLVVYLTLYQMADRN